MEFCFNGGEGMIKRPLSFTCLLFLLIQGLLLILTSGQSLVKMPASSIFQKEEGQEVFVEGQVYKKRNTSNIQILYLKNNSFYDSKILIYDSDFTEIPIGKTMRLKGTITHFDTAHNPGNYDQSLYYAKEEIYGAIWCEEVLEIKGETSEIKEALYQLKLKWKKMLIETVGEENGEILSAMLLGEKSEMDAEVKELYQKNGIGHVLAISGLHISFIGLGIYRIIRKTGIPYLLSGIFAIVILSLYAAMIGFSTSVFRAYVMLLVKIGADMSGRVYDMLTALMLSAALTIGYQPLYLTDAGFYMSYGAILGILVIMPAFQKSFLGKKKWLSACSSGICVNIALFPIQLWYYFEFPLYSVMLNMIVIPLMSVLLGAGMIGSGIYMVWKPLGQLCLKICHLILVFYKAISEMGIKLPFARVVTGQPEIWEVVLYYMILAVILTGICKKLRRQILLFVTGIFLLVYRPTGSLQVTMLDVGQGDGIFVKGPTGTTYFIDGGSSDVEELGKYRIEPYLKSQGAGTLDYVFISHGDIDHYSGIKEMLGRQEVGIHIRNLVLPENYKQDEALLELASLARQEGTAVKVIKAGVSLKEKEFTVTCLQPDSASASLSGNAGSMVLELDYGEFEMLCTGDAEAAGEELLIKNVQGKNYDVLKVAHHGSRNSTSEAFLKTIDAEIAWISAGAENSYGHPHEETLQRLMEYGCNIYETSESGAIHLKTDGKDMSITVFH